MGSCLCESSVMLMDMQVEFLLLFGFVVSCFFFLPSCPSLAKD